MRCRLQIDHRLSRVEYDCVAADCFVYKFERKVLRRTGCPLSCFANPCQFVMLPKLACSCRPCTYLLLSGTFTLQFFDVLVQFIKVLPLGSEFLLQFPQASSNSGQQGLLQRRARKVLCLENACVVEEPSYLSISFSRMNLVSLACSRLVQESLCSTY